MFFTLEVIRIKNSGSNGQSTYFNMSYFSMRTCILIFPTCLFRLCLTYPPSLCRFSFFKVPFEKAPLFWLHTFSFPTTLS